VKERKFRNDWQTVVSLDEATGREKRTPVYRGAWYTLGEAEKRSALVFCAGCVAAFWAALIGWFLLDPPGTRVLYVFLPAALSLFPAAYALMGLAALVRLPGRMTRLQREKSLGRLLHSGAGAAVLTALAGAGDLVYIFVSGFSAREGAGLALLLLCAAAAGLAARRSLRVQNGLAEQAPAEP